MNTTQQICAYLPFWDVYALWSSGYEQVSGNLTADSVNDKKT
ncbi:MAG: hypothetical protein ACOVSR_13945 [Bacteroidia bacterium]